MWSDAYDMRAAGLLTFLILIIKMAIIWLLFTFFWFFCSSKRALHSLMLIKVAVVGSKEEAWQLIKLDGSCFLGSLGPFFLIYSLFFRMQSICFAFEICVQKNWYGQKFQKVENDENRIFAITSSKLFKNWFCKGHIFRNNIFHNHCFLYVL